MSNKYPNHLVLLALRVTNGESQMKCAYRLGCASKTISNWETCLQKNLTHFKMRRVYSAYKVTPQVAQQITSEYLADLRHEGRPHPEDRDARPAQESRELHAAGIPDTIIGFGPEGHAITLHCAIGASLRDRKPTPGYICDALIRHLNGKRTQSGESADLI